MKNKIAKVINLVNKIDPYIAFLARKYELVFNNGINTMGTDGITIFVNSKYFAETEIDVLALDVVHQLVHIIGHDYEDEYDDDIFHDDNVALMKPIDPKTIELPNDIDQMPREQKTNKLFQEIILVIRRQHASLGQKYSDSHALWPRRKIENPLLINYTKEAISKGIIPYYGALLLLYKKNDYDFLNSWDETLMKYIIRDLGAYNLSVKSQQIIIKVIADSNEYSNDYIYLILLYLRNRLFILKKENLTILYTEVSSSDVVFEVDNEMNFNLINNSLEPHIVINIMDYDRNFSSLGIKYYLSKTEDFIPIEGRKISLNYKDGIIRNINFETRIQDFRFKNIIIQDKGKQFKLRFNITALVEKIYDSDKKVYIEFGNEEKSVYNVLENKIEDPENLAHGEYIYLNEWFNEKQKLIASFYDGSISINEFFTSIQI